MRQIVANCWPTAPEHEVKSAADRVLKRLRVELKEHDTSLRSLSGDGWSAEPLSQRELQVLTAVSVLNGKGTVLSILRTVESWSDGLDFVDVMLTLAELKNRGLMTRRQHDPAEGIQPLPCQITEEGE